MTRYLLAVAFALLLSMAYLLDGPSELDAIEAVADEVHELNGGGK